MTTLKQSILDSAKALQQELDTILEGMDYCLDWKQDDDEWSAREILWHVLEDPEGGIPRTVEGILDGSMSELTIIADETHLNDEREAMDMEGIKGALSEYFDILDSVLANATDEDISTKSVSCWFPLRNHREDRTAQNLLEGLFLNHWRDHLGHLRHIREDLGLD